MTKKDLLYSRGHYTQYLVITYNEKESKKEYVYSFIYIFFFPVCMCMHKDHFALHLKLTQHCRSTIFQIKF